MVIHSTGDSVLFVFPDDRDIARLSTPRGHRAIGVVFDPDTEHRGNWAPTVKQRDDGFIYLGTYPWGR